MDYIGRFLNNNILYVILVYDINGMQYITEDQSLGTHREM